MTDLLLQDVVPPPPAYRTIPLTQGQVAIVDAHHYGNRSKHKWQALQLYPGRFYAARTEGKKAQQKTIFMAREIMNALPGELIDHRKCSMTLDNRESNLRRATYQQNSFNRGPHKGRKFKGVFWFAKTSKWRAMIRVDGLLRGLGLFDLPEDAARAYDAAAIFHFGEFAWLNFPDTTS